MSHLNTGCDFESDESRLVFMNYVPAMSGSLAATIAFGATELANASEAIEVGSTVTAAAVGFIAVRKFFGWIYNNID